MNKRKIWLIISIFLFYSSSVLAQQIQMVPIGPVEYATQEQQFIQQMQPIGQTRPAKIEKRNKQDWLLVA